MKSFFRFTTLGIIAVLILSACSFPPTASQGINQSGSFNLVTLNVQAAVVGPVINYTYTVNNDGDTSLAMPVTFEGDKATGHICGNENPGPNNGVLDPGESVTCTSTYSITTADLGAGSVTTIVTAKVAGVASLPFTSVVQLTQNRVLTLTGAANPTTYSAAGQTITYNYIITNTNATALNPPFTITDNHVGNPLGTPFTCDSTRTTPLAQGQTVTCTAPSPYIITAQDLMAPNVINSATASTATAGVPASLPASFPVTNTTVITATPSSTSAPPSNLVPGSTILHTVVKGEWLIQIARCYGANYTEVRNANPQVIDPHWILPGLIVTVPRIGSVSKIYGIPCVESYTVQSGDTWESIALKYNADVKVLQARNGGGALSPGRVLIVPRNSLGGSIAPLPGTPTFTPTATATPTATLTPASAIQLQLAADINPGTGNSYPSDLAVYKGVLYFSADKGDGKGVELWKYDGTNPSIVADINQEAGSTGSFPSYLTVYKDVLYFSADSGIGEGVELWRYDSGGAVDQTNPRIVNDFNPDQGVGSNPMHLTVDTRNDADPTNDVLYFSADSGDGITGRELYRYDEASNKPVLVKDINPGLAASSNPADLTVYKGALHFRADGGTCCNNPNAGTELWKYDPATSSITMADIAPGTNSSFPEYLAVYTKNDTDPTNDMLYFSANDGKGTTGVELWKSDGNIASPAFDFKSGQDSSYPRFLIEYGGVLYLQVDGGLSGTIPNAGPELWKYDGTNPSIVVDIWPGPTSSVPAFLTVYNGWLYFSANGSSNPAGNPLNAGWELWRFKAP